MKYLKRILFVAIAMIAFTSCETDDFGPVEATSSNPEQVKVSFKDTNDNAQLFEGETVEYRLGMPTAIDGSVEVLLEVTSSDGEVEAVFTNPIVLERGQREIIFEFTPSDDGVSESSEVYTLKIKEINATFIDGSTTFFAFNGDNTRTLGVRDVPTPIVTTAGDLTFNFTWSGNSDLDCRLVDNPPAFQYDTGYTTTPGETVTLVDAVPDGDYLFRVRPWTVSDTSIDYAIDVVAPTETQTFSGTFTDLTGFWSMEFVVLEINKSTSGSVVTYTINQL